MNIEAGIVGFLLPWICEPYVQVPILLANKQISFQYNYEDQIPKHWKQKIWQGFGYQFPENGQGWIPNIEQKK